MRDCCGQLCSNESFMTMDDIIVIYCKFSLFQLLAWIGCKEKIHSNSVLMVVNVKNITIIEIKFVQGIV